jgi:hypothetical protein
MAESFDSRADRQSTTGKRSTSVAVHASKPPDSRGSEFWCRKTLRMSALGSFASGSDQLLRASRFITILASCSRPQASAQLLTAIGEYLNLTLHDLPPSCRSGAQPRRDLCSTNFDHVCFLLHLQRAWSDLQTAVQSHSFASLRFSYFRVLLPASLGQTVCVHSPSHLELCASSTNGFFRGTHRTPTFVSDSLMPRNSVYYLKADDFPHCSFEVYLCYTAPPSTFKDGPLARRR